MDRTTIVLIEMMDVYSEGLEINVPPKEDLEALLESAKLLVSMIETSL